MEALAMGFIPPTTSPSILQRSTIFTKINLRNAYNLVHIREGDEWKTEHYGYLVRPFQALVNVMLCYMLDKHIIDLHCSTGKHQQKYSIKCHSLGLCQCGEGFYSLYGGMDGLV